MAGISPDKQIMVTFNHKERVALLNHSTAVADSFLGKLRNAKKSSIVFSHAEFRSLLDGLDHESKHAGTQELKGVFRRLHDRLAGQFSPVSTGGLAPDPLAETLQAFFDKRSFGSIDELNLVVQEATDAYNNRGDPQMGGLSPNQVARLIHLKWDDRDNPIKLNRDLPLCDLQQSELLVNVRILLENLLVQTIDTATATGNLNRKFVKLMIDKMPFSDEFKERLGRYNKVINEMDVFPLHLARIICTLAGLVRKVKRRFVVTNKARIMLTDEKAGELYAALFYTFFRKFNLSYLDSLPDYPGLQATITYSLYRLKVVGGSWRTPGSLVGQILLPRVIEDLQRLSSTYITPDRFIKTRVIQPLQDFALMECTYRKDKIVGRKLDKVKTTALFDRFIHFSFDR